MANFQTEKEIDRFGMADLLARDKQNARSLKSVIPKRPQSPKIREDWATSQQSATLPAFPGNRPDDNHLADQADESDEPTTWPQRESSNPRQERQAQVLIDKQVSEGIDPKEMEGMSTKEKLEHIGKKLKEDVENCDLKAFFLLLFIAMLKDFFDLTAGIITLGLLGSALNFAVSVIMIVVFRISFYRLIAKLKWALRQKLISMAWKRLMLTIFAETIPIVNFFPLHTINIILMKISIDRERKKLEGKLVKVAKMNKSY